MERRDFLLLRPARRTRVLELSCERLYMKYLDAQVEETTGELLDRLRRELDAVRTIRLTDTAWLARDDFNARIQPLLSGFRSRGGRVIVDRGDRP